MISKIKSALAFIEARREISTINLITAGLVALGVGFEYAGRFCMDLVEHRRGHAYLDGFIAICLLSLVTQLAIEGKKV